MKGTIDYRFLTGGANEEEEEEEEGERDPNIIRGDKKTKKEELHFDQVEKRRRREYNELIEGWRYQE